MARSTEELVLPFKRAKAYWYLVPRAFWPYADRPEGIPGFHVFLDELIQHQQRESIWTEDSELEVLIMLEDKGIVPAWEEQEDFHVHFRNRVNFAKKIGFATAGQDRPLELTQVGIYFLESAPELWPEIFEHQLVRLQFTNPSMPQRYNSFHLFPYIFTISLLLETPGNSLPLDEFILRVTLSQSHDEKTEVLEWLEDFRSLSDTERASAGAVLEPLRHGFAARMILLLFAYTPALEFTGNTLTLRDKDRARYIFAKCWPRLDYVRYPNLEAWEQRFGTFDHAFWPLIPAPARRWREAHQQYVRREESDAHKSIKRHLIENVEAVFGARATLFDEEYVYASGDSANLIFSLPNNRYVAVEVEVDVGKDDIAGLLQAIKYKYMFAVQERLDMDQVGAVLAARSIHPSVKELCNRYGVESIEVQPTGD